jgi:hypothetical protein
MQHAGRLLKLLFLQIKNKQMPTRADISHTSLIATLIGKTNVNIMMSWQMFKVHCVPVLHLHVYCL